MSRSPTGWNKYRLHLAVNRDHGRRLREAIVVQYGANWKAVMDELRSETPSAVSPHPACGLYVGGDLYRGSR